MTHTPTDPGDWKITTLSELLWSLDAEPKPESTAPGWKASCPAHASDRTDNLNIGTGPGGCELLGRV